jgi:interleukin-1 receptor-associated kinase 1
VVGTRGYIAYETFFTGRASLDTDVYAFGVFIMEVVSGRFPSSSVSYRNQDEAVGRTHEAMYIVDWICRHYGEGKVLAAADTVLGGMYDEAQVDCAVRLAVACCHPNPRERPSMRTVVQVLMGGTPPPEPPYVKPAFVWPPSGSQLEIELPHVGLLFTGGQTSFCSMTSTSLTGR